MNLFRIAAAVAALQFATCAFAQSEIPFSSLEERMTGREFTQTGLHKLSPEELAALNQWIRARSLATLEEPQQTAAGPRREGLPEAPSELPPVDRMAREPFQTRIDGTFSGWSGDTEFVLQNGMVWRQDESGRFRIQPVENPRVTIKPGFGGSWRLSVEGHNRTVRVERIK